MYGDVERIEDRRSTRYLEPKHRVDQVIPYALLLRIHEFTEKQIHKNRTVAINQLIEAGLLVADRLPHLKDPEFVAEVREQMKEGGLVDYVTKMTPKQFEILASIVETEKKERLRHDGQVEP